ncbi:hypothetical protein ACFWPK_22485 [Nocardia sp. NPDC058519]|uniref:hypothetical protein n=1 Tax=Nocardia sp. NPDC058519 TaxID=3346535 RepID=UPI00364A3EBE
MTAAFGISFTAEAEVTHAVTDANRALVDADQAAMRAQKDLAASRADAAHELEGMHTELADQED